MAASFRQQLLHKSKIIKLLNFNNSPYRSELCYTYCYIRHRSRHGQSFTQSYSRSPSKKHGNRRSDEARPVPGHGVMEAVEYNPNVNEDFFGIPDEYKLQHVRMGSKSTMPRHISQSTPDNAEAMYESGNTTVTESDSVKNSIGSEHFQQGPTSSIGNETKQQSRHKRRQKRTMKADFPTSFGVISFDQTSYQKTAGDLRKLALKAQKILKTSGKNDFPGSSAYIQGTPNLNEGIMKSISSAKSKGKEKTQNTGHDIFDEQYFGMANVTSNESFPWKCNTHESSYVNNNSEARSSEIENITSKPHDEMKNLRNENNKLESSFNEAVNPNANFFDRQYFNDLLRSENLPHSFKDSDHSLDHSDDSQNSELNVIDQQYFDKSDSGFHSFSEYNPSSLGAVAEQYFQVDNSHSSDFTEQVESHNSQPDFAEISPQETIKPSQGLRTDQLTEKKSSLEVEQRNRVAPDKSKTVNREKFDVEKTTDNIVTNDSFLKRLKGQRTAHMSKIPNEELKSDSALSFAMKVRRDLQSDLAEKQDVCDFKIPRAYDTETQIDKDDGIELVGTRCRFDSKGYRILDLQVPNFDQMTSSDVLRMLKNRIIFNHYDFLAIDKPYGLPSFGQQNDRLSVSGLLPALVPLLPHSYQASQLHIVQGLDRDVTGVLILAKTPEITHDLRLMYNNSESCIQRFWAITKGVPKPPEGMVDIPIGEGKIAGRYKPMLRPLYKPSLHPQAKLSKAPSKAATTEYRVLSRNETAALVECTPLTNGVKHQLRVHLTQALNTPILGDHKYSHFAKLAPQKLDPNTLGLLKIRQAKVRHLALHLHLRSVVFTDYKGRMIFLTTRPPVHFVDNLRSLKLQMPKK